MALIGSNFRRVSVLDVFIFHTLLSGRSPEKFVKKDIFTKEKVLIPALQNSHWTLLVMDMKDTTVWVFDSSENESLIQANIVRNYMEDLLAEWEQNPSRKYRLKIKKNLPKQTGSSDCGVYMCQFALCVASGTAINFISSDINRFRRKMVFE